jgi:leucyl/phenylalanyl-tRNA--protein transferase
MPVYRIPSAHVFPDPTLADSDGLLGVGGDLDPHRILVAYRMGIFPWFSEDQPILWWSPDPRVVLPPEQIHVPRSLAKRIRRGDYQITLDQAFDAVIHACGEVRRPGQSSTWITPEMEEAYNELFRMGHAHSCEAWLDGELVGGLYGVAVGGVFCGESMFARAPDASKVAFVQLARQLAAWSFGLIDCQVHTSHLERFGAQECARDVYLERLAHLAAREDRIGSWAFDASMGSDSVAETSA